MKSDTRRLNIRDIKRTNCFIPECLEHALTLFEEEYNIPISAAYMDEWYFDMKEATYIGTSIKIRDNLFENLLRYSGVQISCVNVTQRKEILEAIEKNNRDGFPTLIHLDTYFCEWGMFYKKIHSSHVVIAREIDYEERRILIVDPDYSENAFWIKFSLVDVASKFYYNVVIIKRSKITYRDRIELLCNNCEKIEKSFDRLEKFATYFMQSFNPKEEFSFPNDIDCVLESELIYKIRHVIKCRNMFVVFLEKCQPEVSYCRDIIELLLISMGKWNSIMNIIFKSARTQWDAAFNYEIYEIIKSTISVEKEACRILLTKEPEKRVMENSDIIYNELQSVTIPIDLFCNNKGFSIGENDKGADLTSAGEFVKLKHPYGRIKFNGLVFKSCFHKMKDNIVCKKQEIKFDIDARVYGIGFLLCAEWGACEDAVTIKFSETKHEVFKLVANDISQIDMENTIEVGCSVLQTGKIVNHHVCVTVQCAYFYERERVYSVILPNNPNIHILSIIALE